MKLFNADMIRALTPIFMALVGGVIGLAVLYTDADPASLGVATSAIVGAAGLAQAGKSVNPKS